jgi:tyrosine-protein kinase Etk/Wzc
MKLSDIMLDGFQNEKSKPLNLQLLILKYLKYWYLFLAGVVLCVGTAVYMMYYATPQYLISSTLLIKADDKGSDFSQNAVFADLENYQTYSVVENEIEILQSASIMRRVFSELELYNAYFVEEGFSRKREIYGREVPINIVIHEYDSLGYSKDNTIKIHLVDEEGFEIEDVNEKKTYFKYGEKIQNFFGEFSVERNSPINAEAPHTIFVAFNHLDALAGAYSGAINVEVANKLASVLNVSLLDPVPQKGRDIVNKLIEVYNKEAVFVKNQIAANTIEFIDEQLETITAELFEIEARAENYKQANQITNVSAATNDYLTNTSSYQSQIAANAIKIDVLQSIEQYLVQQEDNFQMVPSSLTIDDPTFLNLLNKFNELQRERERMLRTTQPSNPLVLNINEQLDNLKRSLLENLRQIKTGLEITNRNLVSSNSDISSRAQRVPEIERQLVELSRQQAIKEEHFLYLTKKREESALSLAATTVSNSRVIDPATSSNGPVKPNKKLIYAFAFMLGLGMPFGFIFLKDMLNTKVLYKSDIEDHTLVPILGEISHHNTDEILAISEKVKTPVAEQFRLLRTNLQFATAHQANKVILVTSSKSGEGKTFFSLNLAVSLSMTDKNVVILEFDLRKPALLKKLKIKNDIGLSDFLSSDKYTVEDLFRKSAAAPDITLIGCGDIPPNPAELMMSKRMHELFEELQRRFDVVIIDSAPVGQVADAFALAPFIDQTLYVVRYNYTTKDQIDFIDDIGKNKKLSNPMIVMNDAKKVMGYGYGYGYEYADTKH